MPIQQSSNYWLSSDGQINSRFERSPTEPRRALDRYVAKSFGERLSEPGKNDRNRLFVNSDR
jgi:hypothetical protein